MRLDKRHEEIINSLNADSRLEVVEYFCDLKTLSVSTPVPLRLSRSSRNGIYLGIENNPRFVFSHKDVSARPQGLRSLRQGLSFRRIYQICPTGDFQWSLLTTEKYATEDLERFKSFVARRAQEYHAIVKGEKSARWSRRRRRKVSTIPQWVRDACEEFVMKSNAVNRVHTPCRNCAFATFEGKTQTGCYAGQLDKYRKLDCVVEAYDHEREFSIVNGRHCLAYRTPDMLQNVEVPKGKTLFEVIREQMSLKIDFIIIFNEESTMEGLEASIRSILNQTPKPNSIIVASNQSKIRPYQLTSMMNSLGVDCRWYVVNLRLRAEDGSLLSDGCVVDEAFEKCNGQAYVRLNAGFALPCHVSQQLDKYVIDELNQFTVLEQDSTLPIEVVANSFHRHAKGNAPLRVTQPAEEFGSNVELSTLHTLPEKAKFFQHAEETIMLKKVGDVLCSK